MYLSYLIYMFNLSQQSGTRQLLTHAPTSRAEERIERLRAGKLMHWGQNCSVKKAKATHKQSKTKQEIILLFPMAGRCSAIFRRGEPHYAQQLLG